MKRLVIPVMIGATEIVAKELENICKQHQESIEWVLYKKQLY